MDADRKRFSTWHAHPRALGFDQGIGDGQPVVSVSLENWRFLCRWNMGTWGNMDHGLDSVDSYDLKMWTQ
jgi:hypothetical protein